MNRFFVTASHSYDNWSEEHPSLEHALASVQNTHDSTINDVIEWNPEKTRIVARHGTWKNGVRYASLAEAVAGSDASSQRG